MDSLELGIIIFLGCFYFGVPFTMWITRKIKNWKYKRELKKIDEAIIKYYRGYY